MALSYGKRTPEIRNKGCLITSESKKKQINNFPLLKVA
jgi:hypothetical protein